MNVKKLTTKEFEDLIFNITSELDEPFILLKAIQKEKIKLKNEEKFNSEIESWDLQLAFPISTEKIEKILTESNKKIININGMKITIEKE